MQQSVGMTWRLLDALRRLDDRLGVGPKPAPPHPPDEPLTRYTDALRAFGIGWIGVGTAPLIGGLLFSDVPVRSQLVLALWSGFGGAILAVVGVAVGLRGALNWAHGVDPRVPALPGRRALVQLAPLSVLFTVSAFSLVPAGDGGIWAGGIVFGLAALIQIQRVRRTEDRLEADLLVRLRWFGPEAYYLRPRDPSPQR